MNSRAKFLATMHFEPTDSRPLWEWHYLEDTVERWHTEGLPENVCLPQSSALPPAVDADARDSGQISVVAFFGLDRGQPYCQGALAYVPVNTGMVPPFQVQYFEEDQETQTLVLVSPDGAMEFEASYGTVRESQSVQNLTLDANV